MFGCLAFTACKKSTPTPEPTPEPTATGSREDLTRDSIFLYAKQIYLWNTALPTYQAFNPRKYTTQGTPIDNYRLEIFDISKYSVPYEYKVGATSPKFSSITDLADQNPSAAIQSASVDTEGNGNDIGIRFGYYGTTTNYVIYATAIYQNSPAEKAGFKRGDKITKINGVAYGSNFDTQYSAIYAATTASSVLLEGFKADGTPFSTTLTKAVFKSSPIYNARTITAGTKKIGYLAYARFSTTENSEAALNAVFTSFANDGVTDLVIDLRYNGGGFISTAEQLVNLIAPSSLNGSVMFSEHYNSTMQTGAATILAKQPLLDQSGKIRYQNGRMLTYADVPYSVAANTTLFSKRGPLNGIQNVVFIVAGGTASASELVINSLRPYLNVKLVGQTTYGKPVGFFPVTIENKYEVYFSMFEIKNSSNFGNYYDGFVPDYVLPEVPSGTIMYEFGNVNDYYLKTAINALVPGVTPTGQISIATKLSSVVEKNVALPTNDVINSKFDGNDFKGMIEDRLYKRVK